MQQAWAQARTDRRARRSCEGRRARRDDLVPAARRSARGGTVRHGRATIPASPLRAGKAASRRRGGHKRRASADADHAMEPAVRTFRQLSAAVAPDPVLGHERQVQPEPINCCCRSRCDRPDRYRFLKLLAISRCFLIFLQFDALTVGESHQAAIAWSFLWIAWINSEPREHECDVVLRSCNPTQQQTLRPRH